MNRRFARFRTDFGARGTCPAERFEVVTRAGQLDELRQASRYPKLQAVLQPHRIGVMVSNRQRAIALDHVSTEGIEAAAHSPDRRLEACGLS